MAHRGQRAPSRPDSWPPNGSGRGGERARRRQHAAQGRCHPNPSYIDTRTLTLTLTLILNLILTLTLTLTQVGVIPFLPPLLLAETLALVTRRDLAWTSGVHKKRLELFRVPWLDEKISSLLHTRLMPRLT